MRLEKTSSKNTVACVLSPVYCVLVGEQTEGEGGIGDWPDIELLAHLSETRRDGVPAQQGELNLPSQRSYVLHYISLRVHYRWLVIAECATCRASDIPDSCISCLLLLRQRWLQNARSWVHSSILRSGGHCCPSLSCAHSYSIHYNAFNTWSKCINSIL